MDKKLVDQKELNLIFSSLDGLKHVLYLYSPSINKYLIHASFLSNGNGKAAYVTAEDSELVTKKFKGLKNFSIIHPKNIGGIIAYKRIIIDAASIEPGIIEEDKSKRKRIGEKELIKEYINHSKREKFLVENCKDQSIICTYDISKLNPAEIKSLVNQHDKLILSTDSRTVLSSKSLSTESLSTKKLMNSELIDEFVKRELKTIVLAMIARTPMCGREIKLEIYKKFGILLSSGTLYPLLHQLEKKNLLECTVGIKTKTYNPANHSQIRKIVSEHIEVKNFLNKFLQSSIIKEV